MAWSVKDAEVKVKVKVIDSWHDALLDIASSYGDCRCLDRVLACNILFASLLGPLLDPGK